jgi:hypothetical protein
MARRNAFSCARSERLREISASELSIPSALQASRITTKSSPIPFQIFHASLGASIRVDIVVGLELSVDNINEFTDFDADVVTSLFVVLGTLIQKLAELTTSFTHRLTSTVSIILFTAKMRPSNCGIGDNFATTVSISKALFRPL